MEQLTILTTQNIKGDLALLPRLFRFIDSLKQAHDPQALLLDLGESCASEVWHCAATEGRSTLMVLEAMGYHAANATHLSDSARETLKSTSTMGLITARHAWRYHVPPIQDEDILVAGQATPALKLCIIAQAAPKNLLENRMLHLQRLEKGQVGLVKIELHEMTILEESVFTMPEGLKPEATISAAIELVEEEAHYAQRRKGKA